MRNLVTDIVTLCGYQQVRLGSFDLSHCVSPSQEIHATVTDYFSSCVPSETIDRPFFQLFSPEDISEALNGQLPACVVVEYGFVNFASEPNGDLIAVNVNDGKVYVLPHECLDEHRLDGNDTVVPETVIRAAIRSFENLSRFFEHWHEELIKLHDEDRAFAEASASDPTATDESGNQMIIHAIREGDLSWVENEVDRGADLESLNDEGRTVLGEAVVFGQVRIAEYLIVNGANVNARGKYGSTPLMLAAHHAKLGCIELLLRHGADANIQDEFGQNALKNLCRIHGTPEMKTLLEEHVR